MAAESIYAAQLGLNVAGSLFGYSAARKEAKANKREIARTKLELMVNNALEALDERQSLASWQGTAQAMAAASGVEMSGSIKGRVIQAAVDSEKALARKRLNLNRNLAALERQRKQQDRNLRGAAVGALFGLGTSALTYAGQTER